MGNSNFQLFPNLGTVNISLANNKLDGTGSISNLITGSDDGTSIISITIKAQSPTSQGMVRLFINDGTKYYLFQEVPIPATTSTNVVESFSAQIDIPIQLKKGYSIGVSTQYAELFSVVADGTNFKNCDCAKV